MKSLIILYILGCQRQAVDSRVPIFQPSCNNKNIATGRDLNVTH